MIEQMLEREPGAGEIEQNLIEAGLLVRFAGSPVRMSAAISAEVLGEHCADQFARRNSSVPRHLLNPFQQLRRQADGIWNLRHRTALHFLQGVHAVHFNESGDLG